MKFPFLIGRIAFGGFFLYSGINHFLNLKEMAQYVKSKNVPLPEVAVAATGAALVFGGVSVLAGVKPKVGAAALTAFLAAVSPIMHDFWRIENPDRKMQEMVNFMKNLALLGAALALLGIEEPWPVSIPLGQPNLQDRAREVVRKLVA